MNANSRNLFGAVIFFTIVLATVGLAIGLIVGMFYGAPKPDFAAIGELLLVVVIGAGEAVAFFELRHIAKERQFQCLLRAQEIWSHSTFVIQRGEVFQRSEKLNADWSDQQVEVAKEVCRKMDEFAHLAPFLGVQTMLDTWDVPLARAWRILEPIVQKERTGVARWATKWEAFANIGQQAVDKLIREGTMSPAKQSSK